MNIRHGSSHPMQSRLAGLARTWRQTLAGLAIVGIAGTLAFVWVVLALRGVPSEGGQG